MSETVRRVVIETEVRSADGRRGSSIGAAGGSSRRVPLGIPGGGSRSSSARVSKAAVANHKNRSNLLKDLHRKEEHLHRQKKRWLDEESRLVKRISDTRRRGGSTGGSSGGTTGHSRNPMGHGGSFFTTGIPMLDRANQLGFQAFITTMTVRMIGQALTGAMSGLAGISGEGDGMIAQGARYFKGDPRSKNDPIRQFFRDNMGDLARASFGPGEANMLGLGTRAGRWIDQGTEISGRASALAQGRYTSSMRSEDDLIRQKRDLLREEMNVLRQRIQADQALVDRALGRREGVIQSFGRMGAKEQQQALSIAGKIRGGAGAADLTREDRQFMAANDSLFQEVNSVFAHNSATAGGVDSLLNLRSNGSSINSRIQDRQRQMQRNMRDRQLVREEASPVLSAQLNIERLELDSQEIVDQINDALAPQWEKVLEQIRDEVRGLIDRMRNDARVGNDAAPSPIFLPPGAGPGSFR